MGLGLHEARGGNWRSLSIVVGLQYRVYIKLTKSGYGRIRLARPTGYNDDSLQISHMASGKNWLKRVFNGLQTYIVLPPGEWIWNNCQEREQYSELNSSQILHSHTSAKTWLLEKPWPRQLFWPFSALFLLLCAEYFMYFVYYWVQTLQVAPLVPSSWVVTWAQWRRLVGGRHVNPEHCNQKILVTECVCGFISGDRQREWYIFLLQSACGVVKECISCYLSRSWTLRLWTS